MASSTTKQDVTVKPDGGHVSVEVFFGYALVGRFNVYIQDKNNRQEKVGSAGTVDGGETVAVSINKDASDLVGSWICLDTTVVAPDGEEGQYLVVTTIRQDGNALTSIQQSGDLTANSQGLLTYVRCL